MTCRAWEGAPSKYQDHAVTLVPDHMVPSALGWISQSCGTPACVTPDHLVVREPVRLRYPYGLCIYCGRHAGTRDHLLPSNWTGLTARKFVVTVPACGTCNGLLGDTITLSITERREICHERLRRKYKKVLATPDWTEAALDELGPGLRGYIEQALDKKAEVRRMLAWPDEDGYDLRALAASNVDPYESRLVA